MRTSWQTAGTALMLVISWTTLLKTAGGPPQPCKNILALISGSQEVMNEFWTSIQAVEEQEKLDELYDAKIVPLLREINFSWAGWLYRRKVSEASKRLFAA